jgi:phosphoribosyl 1,2-cyclic phosphodiesterase
MAIECRKQKNAKRLVFFHYDPSYDDDKLNRIQEQYKQIDQQSILAYEGLEINLL